LRTAKYEIRRPRNQYKKINDSIVDLAREIKREMRKSLWE
jgi:hypothetical protein